jgi:hypothetical protein
LVSTRVRELAIPVIRRGEGHSLVIEFLYCSLELDFSISLNANERTRLPVKQEQEQYYYKTKKKYAPSDERATKANLQFILY